MAWLHLERLLGLDPGPSPLAALAVSGVGLLLLLFGWRLSRLAVMALAFALGATLGQSLAKAASVHPAWGVGLGGGLLALLAGPFFKLGVFLAVGAVGGALAGAAAQGLGKHAFWWVFVPAGLLCGALAVWLTRPLVILATSLMGALAWLGGAVTALGGWGLPSAGDFPAAHPWAWGVILALAAAVGVGVQARFSPRRLDQDGAEQEDRAHVA
jgi:hypothetical protein